MGRKVINRIGQRFGMLVVIQQGSAEHPVSWVCQCDCGNIKTVQAGNLQSGKTKTCGCTRGLNHAIKHGLINTVEYRIWSSMRTRCNSDKTGVRESYKDKGITVCDRWNSFENFLNDMGKRPDNTSIDRIDNSRGYEPGNCRWATFKTQTNNRDVTILIKYKGKALPLSLWAEKLNINYQTLYNRIVRHGWKIKDALTRPIGNYTCTE